MLPHQTFRLLGRLMVWVGLLAALAVLLLTRDVPVMTQSLGLVMRGQFFGASMMTVAGLWVQRCVLRLGPPAGFPLDWDVY